MVTPRVRVINNDMEWFVCRLSQQTPDIKPRVNPNLAPYLQDVERYNPEFMRHVKTEVHASLPDVQGEW